MWKASSRLFLIAGSVVLWSVLVVFALRYVGLKQEFAPYTHPLLNRPFLLVANGGGSDQEHPPFTLDAYSQIVKTQPKAILGVPVFATKDNRWVVFGDPYLETLTSGSGLLTDQNWEALKRLHYKKRKNSVCPVPREPTPLAKDYGIVPIQQFLEHFPQAPFLLAIHTKYPHKVSRLISQLNQFDVEKRMIVSSTHPGVIKEIREAEPSWLFALEGPKLAQAHILSALFLETLANLEGDIVIAKLDNRTSTLTPRLVKEIARRKKPLLLETNTPSELETSWVKEATKGVLTDCPRSFRAHCVNCN